MSHPDLDADANVGQLWSVPLDGTPPRRITRGFRDSSPKFSPGWEHARVPPQQPKGTPAQLHVMAAGGGEATAITDVKLGVDDFAWSPDSARIAFVAAVAEQGRYGTVEGITPAAEPARRITSARYKQNGKGYLDDQRTHVFVVEVPDADAEPVYPAAPHPDGTTPESMRRSRRRCQLTDGAVRRPIRDVHAGWRPDRVHQRRPRWSDRPAGPGLGRARRGRGADGAHPDRGAIGGERVRLRRRRARWCSRRRIWGSRRPTSSP